MCQVGHFESQRPELQTPRSVLGHLKTVQLCNQLTAAGLHCGPTINAVNLPPSPRHIRSQGYWLLISDCMLPRSNSGSIHPCSLSLPRQRLHLPRFRNLGARPRTNACSLSYRNRAETPGRRKPSEFTQRTEGISRHQLRSSKTWHHRQASDGIRPILASEPGPEPTWTACPMILQARSPRMLQKATVTKLSMRRSGFV